MDDLIDELQARVQSYPPDRYPVQHAAAQFHLGQVLVDAGRPQDAEVPLRTAVKLFEGRLELEAAKSLNALGSALRYLGRAREAAAAFEAAAAAFRRAASAVEEAAALFNLGLVQRDLGRPDEALRLFESARAYVPAAARELGMLLLERGELADAEAAFAEALVRSADAAAANALGLTLLAAGRPGEAVDVLRDALAAHPRSVRPAEHAMVKGNLALAYERAGDDARARVAARQTLAIPGAAVPVAEQARAVLARLGGRPDDLLVLLDATPRADWTAAIREDLPGWTGAQAAAWIDGLIARPETATDLAEAWLSALLELPTDELERLVALVRDSAPAGFRSVVSSASARFHVPQLLRLREVFGWT